MITLHEHFLIEDSWYEVRAEIFPCKFHWRLHRWFVEIDARPSTFPGGKGPESYWTHYNTKDVTAWSLRGAWMKADKQIWKLVEYFEQNPSELPDAELP